MSSIMIPRDEGELGSASQARVILHRTPAATPTIEVDPLSKSVGAGGKHSPLFQAHTKEHLTSARRTEMEHGHDVP